MYQVSIYDIVNCKARKGFPVIKSFGNKLAQGIFDGINNKEVKRFPSYLIVITAEKLDMINAASEVVDLKIPPGNRLKKLSGTLKGFYSIRINDQFRIIFKWSNNEAHEVKVVDYHQ